MSVNDPDLVTDDAPLVDEAEEASPDTRWIKWSTRWDTPTFNMMTFTTLLIAVFLQGPSGADSTLLFGVTLSSFSLATAIASPIVGFWLDKHDMKPALLFLTFVSFAGSMIYALAVNREMILLGRIVAGFGSSIYAISGLYVIRSTTPAERSGLFAKVSLIFAIAMIVGPGVNFPLSRAGTHEFGPFEFSELSSPGWVMAGLFILSSITILCFFKEPAKRKKTVENEENPMIPKQSCLAEWASIFGKFPCLVLITCEFLVIFNQTSIETLLTPLTLRWYKFDSFGNSILFAGMTVLIIIWLLAVGPLTKYLQDRQLLMIGHIMAGCSIGLTVLFLALSNEPNLYIPVWQLSVGAGLFVSSIPFYESVLGSLFSKLLDNPLLDGRGQGIMTSAKATASIFGPLVSSAIFRTYRGFAWVELVMGVMWFVVFWMLVAAWSRMRVASDDEKSGLVAERKGSTQVTDRTDDEVSEVSLESNSEITPLTLS